MKKARRNVRIAAKAKRVLEAKKMKEVRVRQDELRRIARPDTQKSIASVNASSDERWLRGFRARMVPAGESEIVTAIDARLAELDEIKFRRRIAISTVGLSLAGRVRESLRIYEAFLARKHDGKNIRASRTVAMIERWGEKEAVRRTVTNLDMSNGLELLAEYGRLDCSYEQIILDFPQEFDEALRVKARANLARLPPQGS